jgi:hypothetical protein
MVPQSVAFIPAFVQTLDGVFVAAGHIVSLALVRVGDETAWRATTADHRTFHLSTYIAEQLLRGAAKDPKIPQERAA